MGEHDVPGRAVARSVIHASDPLAGHPALRRLMADGVMLKPRPLATVQRTTPRPMTHVKGPEMTRVPGDRSGVPIPGFEPH